MLLNDFLPFSCLSKVATVFAFYNTLCSNQLSLEELLTNKTYSQSSVGLISVTSAQEKKNVFAFRDIQHWGSVIINCKLTCIQPWLQLKVWG